MKPLGTSRLCQCWHPNTCDRLDCWRQILRQKTTRLP